MASHAQIARALTAKIPPAALAHAMRDAVINDDHTTMERMLPGTVFAHRKVGADEWELTGTCEDGSVVVWRVGA